MSKKNLKYRWMPFLLFICMFVIVVCMWILLVRQESNFTKNSLTIEAESLLENIQFDLTKRIDSLKRVVNRWEESRGTPKEQFVNDIESYLIDDPGYQAIEWVDKNFHVRWIVPFKGNEAAQDLNLASEENRRVALELSKKEKTSIVSSPINLVQGGKGFLVYLPIFVEDEFDGFILAVIKIEKWINYQIQHRNNEKVFYSIYINDSVVLTTEGWDKQSATKWDVISESEIYNHKFTIKIKPSTVYLKRIHSVLPEVFLSIGIIFSLFISLIVFVVQKTKLSLEITKQKTKISLEKEIKIRKKTEELLIREKERLAYILEGTNVGTWEWNVQTGETIFNERWASIIGYTLLEISPVSIKTWEKYSHPEDLKKLEFLMAKHFSGELDYFEFEVRMRHKNGKWIWVLDRGKVSTWTEDGKPLFMAGTHKDITDHKHAEEKIKYLATHDKLTNLPSLSLTLDRLSMALEGAKREKTSIGVMFVDLDGFKAVNDNFGHDAGDFVLIEVSERLINTIRAIDTVGRIGGDEFIVILSGLYSLDDIEGVAKKIITNISKEIIFNGIRLKVGTSIGISTFPESSRDKKELIKFADKAMYDVKKSGKNNYIFFKS